VTYLLVLSEDYCPQHDFCSLIFAWYSGLTLGGGIMRSRKFGLAFIGAVITAFGLALAAPAYAVNLVANGSFETGDFTGWTQVGNTGFSGVQCPGPGGTVAQGNCSAFFGPVGSTGGISQTIPLHVGQLYLLTFSFLPDGGSPSSFSVTLGGVTLFSQANPPFSPYRNFSFAVLATAASEPLVFNFRDDPGFLFLDNVQLSVPEPASVGLLGIALVAMFMGLRRKAQ
jgi:hypothetical protein